MRDELKLVQRNLARAKSDEHHEAISSEFDQLKKKETELLMLLQQAQRQRRSQKTPEEEVAAAMRLLDNLTSLADRAHEFAAARELFDFVDAKLFLRFSAAKWGKRDVYRVTGGVLTFGATAPPIKIYEGRTGRVAVQQALKTEQAAQLIADGGQVDAVGRGDSLGNVSRGDRI